jgi:large subunit ribosomal protein L20
MRVTKGAAQRRSRNRLFKEARGNVGARSKLLRSVKETIVRSRAYAYRDRRTRKRDFRRLWITRISGAVMQYELRYSEFVHGLQLAGIELNRKSLSELAIHEPAVFEAIVGAVKTALDEKAA